MTRSAKVMGFLLVAVVGLWGCAKGPDSANTAKNTSLEAKAQRLEEDFRAAAAARDQFKQKLLATEEKLAASETRATQLSTERDTEGRPAGDTVIMSRSKNSGAIVRLGAHSRTRATHRRSRSAYKRRAESREVDCGTETG